MRILLSDVTPVGQGWTNARGLLGLGGPKPDHIFCIFYIYICMLPYIHFCVFTVIEITVIY